jgi:hypothetical protein
MSGLGLGAPVASLMSLVLILIFYASGRWKINLAQRHLVD